MSKLEKEYNAKYGHLPDDHTSQLDYILDNYKVNMETVNNEIMRIDSLKWNELTLSLNIIPKPSPRPRSSHGHFYVKGAKDHKSYFESIVDEKMIICTRVDLSITTYHPIPTSAMSATEIYLAQLGYIDPISNPDWDNLGKTYSDMIQGILLLNDNIVNPGLVRKKYSIKPKIDILIRYQDGFDSKFNERKIITSKNYIIYDDLGLIKKG